MQKHRLHDTNDSTPDPLAELRLLDPDLPDHLWRVITGYQPRTSLDQWKTVREFVIAAVLRMRPRTFNNARRLMTMTARYCCWVWVTTGRSLEDGRVFTDRLLRRYAQTELKTKSIAFRHDVVRQLGTMTEILTGERTVRMPALAAARVAPYTRAEVAAMHSWASTLTTTMKRQNAWAILGLAGGAGLSAADITAAQVEDIEVLDGRVFVTVHGVNPRRIPVLTGWAKTILKSIGKRTSGDLFHGYRLDEYPPRTIQQFLTEHPCTPRPSASRLNCGWLVTLLDAQLPLPIIMELTGYAVTTSLDAVLKYCSPTNVADFTGRIIGEELI